MVWEWFLNRKEEDAEITFLLVLLPWDMVISIEADRLRGLHTCTVDILLSLIGMAAHHVVAEALIMTAMVEEGMMASGVEVTEAAGEDTVMRVEEVGMEIVLEVPPNVTGVAVGAHLQGIEGADIIDYLNVNTQNLFLNGEYNPFFYYLIHVTLLFF
uniref:Uncharacterized protein n=1 Tax=Corethron hystrix TaxID=216773 RepID=A0A7S1BDV9_9STRA|mmetsp:Transcript_21700/g.49340  ORF Transcript_21700/g.49340 Transcript_21700/m.49340 type:complete len:157 (+) Transcript_21700:869-1339(+)